MNERALPAEARELLASYPDTRWVELLLPDVNGMLRGKRLPIDELAKAFSPGVNLPVATLLLDSRGATFETIRYGTTDGDPDGYCRAVPGSLVAVPWALQPSAQLLLDVVEPGGEPFFADSRHVLRRTAERLVSRGLHPVVAAELEFYLLADPGDKPVPRRSRIPGTQMRQRGPQYAALDELAAIDPFLAELETTARVQRLPAGTAVAEFAPAQFEVNLHHVDDPVLACDHAVLLKRAVKNIARRHGFAATFMAKPFATNAGSGLHVHVSLLDDDGRNVFADTSSPPAFSLPVSDTLRHAVGGLAATMAESMAIFAPNANSYRRFAPGFYAPGTPNWGVNHRQLAIRLPLADAANMRLEHRVAGADANPYLVTAAILAGIDHGIEQQCDPGPMIEPGAVIRRQVTLPQRWASALDAFDAAAVLPGYFGEEFKRVYGICRRTESERFHAEISNRDYEWYLRGV